jgi:hypothetical protein
MIIFLKGKASEEEIKKASEEFGDYVKIVVDIAREIVCLGGKFHADAEKELLERGSLQKDIWGGGLDLKNGHIDTTAIINIRPLLGNDTMEIIVPGIREAFLKLAEKYLK